MPLEWASFYTPVIYIRSSPATPLDARVPVAMNELVIITVVLLKYKKKGMSFKHLNGIDSKIPLYYVRTYNTICNISFQGRASTYGLYLKRPSV